MTTTILRSIIVRLIAVQFALSTPCMGLDGVAEQRFADQLKSVITIGNAIELKSSDQLFLAIETEAYTSRVRGGVIFLHSIGEHADWREIIAPLRADLPTTGWRTLSLQLPIIKQLDHDFDQYIIESKQRIRSAIEYLNQSGVYNIVLVGHGVGASIALSYLDSRKNEKNDFTAFIAISMYVPNGVNWRLDFVRAITDLNVKILDIYGSMDSDEVIAGIAERKSLQLGVPASRYQQLPILGANYSFSGLEKTLVKRVRSWLDKRAPSFEIKNRKSAQPICC